MIHDLLVHLASGVDPAPGLELLARLGGRPGWNSACIALVLLHTGLTLIYIYMYVRLYWGDTHVGTRPRD